MKKILKDCTKGCQEPVPSIIKLRLRGKGSGFLEGPKQEECKEPLHLCISTCYYDKYLIAMQRVSELLTKIYADYQKYCSRIGKPVQDLKLKLIEDVKVKRAKPHQKFHIPAAVPPGNDENVNPYVSGRQCAYDPYFYYGQQSSVQGGYY